MAGGPATGPWNTSAGAGARIAVLDSGVDATHPDIAPNLVYQSSFVDQTQNGEPSPCDDGSPQDQTGHGTWVASLATGALGSGTGNVVGVAPQASLLNIKVLERLPSATGASTVAQCEAGQPGGLLSWVLAGINDAVEQHATVIVLSLGSVVDLTTGDGAGWKAQFDSATYAAEQAGAVVVAAVGNDGLNLGGGRYIELPAQARGVLAVVADTNPACAENLAENATCAAGAITRPYYSNYGVTGAISAPGGSYPEGPDTGVSGFVRGACSSGLSNTTDGLPATTGSSFGCFGLGHVPYVQAMGTSAAAPLVAGAVAILRAERPAFTPAQIVALLQSTATTSAGMTEPQLNLPAALAR
ncbi:Subtilase family protein [Bryocella elongata]|uniref:Subtilase family protein n=1 Tax=Bryocella elongata TaxID=863522 RepID=A0A1H5U404_9BACT|nr:Subtilase family protein [Bryocella elongata]